MTNTSSASGGVTGRRPVSSQGTWSILRRNHEGLRCRRHWSAAAFNFFHIPPNESFAISRSQNLAAFAAFVVAALIAVVVAYLTDRLRRGEELRLREAQTRARVLKAADDERRRVVRDLHDGAQQRLIHAVITLKLALGTLREGDAAGRRRS